MWRESEYVYLLLCCNCQYFEMKIRRNYEYKKGRFEFFIAAGSFIEKLSEITIEFLLDLAY